MNNAQSISENFEKLISEILRTNGFLIETNEYRKGRQQVQPDIVATLDDIKYIFEVKVTRSIRTQYSLILNAASQINDLKKILNVGKGIIVVSSDLEGVASRPLGPGIEVWGIYKLMQMSEKTPALKQRLFEFINEIKIYHIETEPLIPEWSAEIRNSWLQRNNRNGMSLLNQVAAYANAPLPTESPTVSNENSPPSRQGEDLATKIEASKPGKSGKASQIFESLCTQALKLLFNKEMTGWQTQPHIEGGFHKLDLIARLVPQHPFWLALAEDFRTRYIVFEFKNYGDAIKQDQIYSTEKYLFITALRSVAIVIARSGENKSSLQARKGALREHGKLILCLSSQELCEMLRGYDTGDDPHELLFAKLDKILVELGR